MKHLTTTQPDADPAMQRVMVESRAQLALAVRDRERATETVAAAVFVAVAAAIAIGFEPGRSFDPLLAAALVALYALATRVEFQMGSGWTDPSQLVFVPMLFLLPLPVVPLVVATSLLVARVPEYASGTVHFDRAVLRIADAWYSVWPVLVFLAAGVAAPDWAQWPIYLTALAAQFGLDLLTTTLRVSLGLGVPSRTVAEELRAIYMVDALLTPIGLLAAFAAVDEPGAVLLLAPLIGLLVVFAHEREARIENALTLSSAYRGTAHLLGELLATNHEYTGRHSQSVVVLAHQVGEALGLDEAALQEVEFGALLHDVGKMAVPNAILNKPGSLTEQEMAVVRRHTLEGEGMLDRIGGVLGEVGAIVRNHHERYDGAGYPDRLSGEQIPMAARVISCCDAFNAMTTDRAYRQAMSIAEALDELRSEAGRQFDPRVVEAVTEIVSGWGEAPEPRTEAAPAPPAPIGPTPVGAASG